MSTIAAAEADAKSAKEREDGLRAFAVKIEKWLTKLIDQSEAQEKANRGRFNSLADASKADAANFKVIREQARKALAGEGA